MYKLMILIPSLDNLPEFEEHWPDFLHLVEQIPGLRQEATSHVQQVVFGRLDCAIVHELFFEDRQSLMDGLASPVGRQAAGTLHRITRKRAVLMLADHKQDNLENIQRYRPAKTDETTE
jgi:hypothetical protein